MKPEPYELDELIANMEKIHEKGDGSFNLPRAIYTLALRIKENDRLNNIRWQSGHESWMALGDLQLQSLNILKEHRQLILHSLEFIDRIIDVLKQASSEDDLTSSEELHSCPLNPHACDQPFV